ncbi:MAG: HAMP domain-containing protein [Treponema sp.]|nr:HAMP domain-containing protein [Treponema sp.]
MKKRPLWTIFIIFILVFIACAFFCIKNLDVLEMEPFQSTTSFVAPAMAKFEKDGNLYVIDSGSFRVICMDTDGNIHYTIEIDKFDEYIRIIDGAVDEAGNLYVYAIEAEYDSLLTKREIIRKYDNRGHFEKEILSISYNDVYTNPRLFSQFGSFVCKDGILTFSRTAKDFVSLYVYDTFRDELQMTVLTEIIPGIAIDDFLVAQLVLKDSQNYAFVLRDGGIYEVIDGTSVYMRASFNWSLNEGGILPWYIFYCDDGNLVFFDMASNAIFKIVTADYGFDSVFRGDSLQRVVPQRYFDPLIAQGEIFSLKGFGFCGNTYSGVFGDIVWLYDGSHFNVYSGDLQLPFMERLRIASVQTALVLGVLVFIAGLCILFIGILNRYISLFIKLTVVIIPLLIIAFILVFSFTFNIMTEQLNEALFNEMIAMAVLSAKMVNGDDIDSITSIRDFHSDEYKLLYNQVKEIVGFNSDPWNKAFYAAIYTGPAFEYVVTISCEEYNLFRPDEAVEGEDYAALMGGQPIADILELYNGTWAFAEAPVYNSKGGVSGMLEIGLDMTGHEIGNLNLKRYVALIVSAVCVIILLVLCILISIIVKRLSVVGRVLHTIAHGDRTARVSYVARDELGNVSHGLNSMAEELQHQFDRITRLNESTIRFVPLQFMEHLGVSDITKMKLGDNVQRDISVLFFDIRYFSVNSEMMTARENFDFINKTLGIAGPIIRKHSGFVDKYIGDAAMALFVGGMDAVRAGIELYQKLVVNRETRVKIGADGINIGVGIHTGSVMMGIVGENERLSSTVISANVNLASRVENLTKQTGSGLLITRDTLNQLAGYESEFDYRFIGMVQAAGVNEVVALFDMLDALPLKEKKHRLATKAVFESGVRKYHMKDYAAAAGRFEKVAAADPQDICASHHLEEAYRHLQNPDLPSVFVFDRK